MSAAMELDQSITKYESYVRADPHNGLLWLELGDFYHRARRFEEAIACFERCLAESPDTVSARSRMASVRISQNRFSDAQAILLELLRAEPENSALHFNLGLARFYQDQWSEANDCFSRALSLGLKSRDNLAYLTRSLHHLGKMREAIEFCSQWQAQAKDDESQAYLALLEMDDGNMARAQELAQEVLTRDPENLHASTVIGSYSVEQQEMETAEKLFQNILRREPENPRAWLGLGLVRLYRQEHVGAIVALEKAVQLMPDHSGTIVALAWVRLAAKDLPGSEKTFRKAIAVDRNFAEAHGGLASALALQVRVDEARQEVRLAHGLDAQNFGGHFAQAVLLKIRGKDEMAKKLLADLLQHAPAPDSQSLIEHLRVYGAKQLQKTPPPRAGKPSNDRQ
jgi:tetratricopeptide (TPR) repeat protein